MKLPFSVPQFLEVFAAYNLAVWPAQIVFYVLALIALLAAFKKLKQPARIISGLLGFMWIWMGAVYHIMYFASINKAAYVFGAAFVIQGLLFLYYGLLKNRLAMQAAPGVAGWIGGLLILYALFIYPAAGYFLGHVFPAAPTFGLPCPTTIFTLGLLAWSLQRPPVLLLVVPLLWAILGTSAAFQLGIKEDLGLAVSAILFIVVLFLWKKELPQGKEKRLMKTGS